MAPVVKNLTTSAGNMRNGFEPWVRKIPWLKETMAMPGRLQSVGSQRVKHDWRDLARTRTHINTHILLVQFSSVVQPCPTLCNPMDCNTPGFPVHHQFPKLAQTHVHWVSDAIQPSHPLWSPSPPAFNLSQHQGLFQWVSRLLLWTKCLSSLPNSNVDTLTPNIMIFGGGAFRR